MIGRGIACAGVGLCLLAPPAQAVDPSFQVTVSPQQVTVPNTQELTYRVRLTTGSEAERFMIVAANASAFFWPDGRTEGALIGSWQANLEGPGTLVPDAPGVHADPICGASVLSLRAQHGSVRLSDDHTLELPANSVSTLVLKTRLPSEAPWPGEEYRLLINARNPYSGPGTLDRQTPVPLDVPAVRADRSGVRLSITADTPTTSPAYPCDPRPPTNAGQPITISGRSDPPLAGQQVVVVAARLDPGYKGPWGAIPVVPIGTVPVAGDGSFVLRDWRPQELGRYAVAARYTSNLPQFADDFSTPLSFDLTAPVPLPPAPIVDPIIKPSAPTPWVGTHIGVRRGIAAVSLRCPPGAQPCGGVLRLAARGGRALSGVRSFQIEPNRRAVLRVGLHSWARRALGRSRRLPATAAIRAGSLRSHTLVTLRHR